MDVAKLKPSDLLDNSQISQIRQKRDYLNVLALLCDWGLIASGFLIFYNFQNFLTFLFCLIIIGSRQFMMELIISSSLTAKLMILSHNGFVHIQSFRTLGFIDPTILNITDLQKLKMIQI